MGAINPVTLVHADTNPLLAGPVKLASGSGTTLVQVGQTITINSSGGGGGVTGVGVSGQTFLTGNVAVSGGGAVTLNENVTSGVITISASVSGGTLNIYNNGSLVAAEPGINFVAGTNMSQTVVDNPGVDVVVTLNCNASSTGVNVQGGTFLTGNVSISGGTGITATETGQTISIAQTPKSVNQLIAVNNAATAVGTAPTLNFIGASSVTLNAGTTAVDVTYTGGGGGSGGGLTNNPACRCHTTTDQTITGSLTAITFETNDYDTASMHSTSVNTSRITPTVAGKYHFHSGLTVTNSGIANAITGVFKLNGSTIIDGDQINVTQTEQTLFSIDCDYQMNGSTDYMEVYMLASAGGSTTAHNNYNPNFSAFLMSS